MSNYNSLKSTIDANIKQNGRQEITGQILNSVLNQMVTTLGTGYQFAGVATTATNPGTPDAKVFYIANGKGTYTNFGGINVTEDEVVVLYWDSSWHKVSTGIASNEKLTELEKEVIYDVTVNNSGATFASLSELLLSENLSTLIPSEVRCGGMSIRFVQSSDNKYVLYRLTSNTFNTTPTNWQVVDDEEGNTIRAPYFVNGYIVSNGTFVSSNDYRCSSFLPCELIAYIADAVDTGINVNYYDENKIHQVYDYPPIVDGKVKLRTGYKYFRYWLSVDKISNVSLVPIKENLENGLKNVTEAVDLATIATKYSGFVLLSSNVDDTTIVANIGSETTDITIKKLIFADHVNDVKYLYPQETTLSIPSDSNLVMLGIIVNPTVNNDYGHYGYYSSNSQSLIQENEVFRPICLCQLYGGEFKIISGAISDKLNSNKIENVVSNISNIVSNTVKEPTFKHGFITTNGSWNDNEDYRCSDLVPCDLIGGFKSLVASTLNINYYNADGSYAEYESIAFVDGVAKPTKKYKYFRFWSSTANIASISIIWIKDFFEEQISNLELSDNKPSNIVYSNKFLSLNKLGAINLLNNQAVVSSDVLTLTTDGVKISQNYAFWPLINSRINNCHTRILFNTANASNFTLRNYGMENGAQGLTTLAHFEIAGNAIQFYDNRAVSYTFDSNSDYLIDIHRIDKFNELSITNVKTGIKSVLDSYVGQTAGGEGLMYDIVAIGTHDENSIIVKSYSIESGVDRPRLMIFGDSITVGYYGTVVNGINTSCYAYKVGKASGMNWLSSGRGGGSFDGFMGGTDNLGFAYEGRLWREIKKLRPDYVMVTLGTNGGGTYSQYKAVIDTIIKAGATPILNTLPIRADGDHIHNVDYVVAANATIMQIWRDYGINGARFDLATSLNNDGETINDTMFGDDYIHPNDAGHTAMYQRVLVDCPYIFLNE